MRYRPSMYAAAFLGAVRTAPEKEKQLRSRFVRLLAAKGDLSQAPKVLAAIKRLLVKEEGGRQVEIELARPPASGSARTLLADHWSAADDVTTRINPALAAGVRITIDGERELDLSLARILQRMLG